MRTKYIRAVNIAGVQTKLYEKIYDIRSLDYRILDHKIFQTTYDVIAANFRYKNPNIDQIKLPFQKNQRKDILQYHNEEILAKWNNFYENEINCIIKYPEGLKPVLRYIADYENLEDKTEERNESDYLNFLRYLYRRYSESFWKKCYLEDTDLVEIKCDYY